MNRYELTHRGETGLSSVRHEKALQSAEIAAQIAEFEARGGKIEQVDGFTFRSKEELSEMAQNQLFNHAVSIEERRKRANKASQDSAHQRGLPPLKFGG